MTRIPPSTAAIFNTGLSMVGQSDCVGTPVYFLPLTSADTSPENLFCEPTLIVPLRYPDCSPRPLRLADHSAPDVAIGITIFSVPSRKDFPSSE